MKPIITIISILFSVSIYAQHNATIKIEDCYLMAEKNYPMLRQKGILDSILQLKIKNWNNNYLPQMSINAQITYQSDVTQISMPEVTMPAIENMPPQKIQMESPDPMSKDQYKISFDINQLLYDGGNTKINKQLEQLNYKIDQKNIDIELYHLKDRVNTFFLAILLYQENEALLQIIKNDLNEKFKKIETQIANGASMPVNANILRAELLKIEIQLEECLQNKKLYLNMLNIITNDNFQTTHQFEQPQVELTNYAKNKRLELELFTLQQQKLHQTSGLFNTRTMPKVFAFMQSGYGKPAFNMLSNEFDYFYLIGAKFSWNIWNWRQNQRDKQIINFQSNIIQTQSEIFDLNQKILLQKEIADIAKYSSIITKDDELISVRKQISETYAAMLDNGVITSTEYITEVNNQLQAELNKKIHEIQLIKAKMNYNFISGQ